MNSKNRYSVYQIRKTDRQALEHEGVIYDGAKTI